MYKIIGADGKEYGPVTVEQLRSWRAQGRIHAQTRVQSVVTGEWLSASQHPELAALFGEPRDQGRGAPPVLTAPRAPGPRRGLAVLSFVLGICSFALCLSALTGVPAILFGHLARRRARRNPERFGGASFAMAGIVLGYVSIVFSVVIAILLGHSLPRVKRPPPLNDCQNNLRQIGLAFKVWALEHNDQYPFNVSSNAGGTLELCNVGPDGFDRNAASHFLLIANELSTPGFLICPNDHDKHVAASFEGLGPQNISYRLRTGTNINSENPQEILAVCPVHGNRLFCDGNVRPAPPAGR